MLRTLVLFECIPSKLPNLSSITALDVSLANEEEGASLLNLSAIKDAQFIRPSYEHLEVGNGRTLSQSFLGSVRKLNISCGARHAYDSSEYLRSFFTPSTFKTQLIYI